MQIINVKSLLLEGKVVTKRTDEVFMNKIDRMKGLIEILNKASRAYYAEDREIMSNFEYDKLYDELVLLYKSRWYSNIAV